MAARVDSGAIIAVRRFPVSPEDDVASLLDKTYHHQLALYKEIADVIAENSPLPVSTEKWTREPFTRIQFNELFLIKPDMTADEIARRIRAVSYGEYRPFIELHGRRFVYQPEEMDH
jgi:methionyl-tRNA formyltransferase